MRASRVFPLPDWVKEEVVRYFIRYLEVSGASAIVLEDEDGFFCLVPYKTRFHRVGDVVRRFYEVFSRASRRYREGVWVTLTTDPKVYEKLDYLTYRYEIMKALNRFFAWLRKRFKRVSYLNVVEFTESGLIHFHIIVFGLRRIEDYRVFTRRLVGWGFGRVNFMYTIVNENGVWRPKRIVNIDNCDGGGLPKDFILASRMGLRDYLAKYLTKTLRAMRALNSILSSSSSSLDVTLRKIQTISNNGISQNAAASTKNGNIAGSTNTNISNRAAGLWKVALYWALRLRFFTYSRDLGDGRGRAVFFVERDGVGVGRDGRVVGVRLRFSVSVAGVRVGRYRRVGVVRVERYVGANGRWYDWLSYPGFLCFDVESATELMY